MWLAIVIGASFYILAFFVGDDTQAGRALYIGEIRLQLSNAINVVATMAFGLGIINLVWVHGANIVRRKKGWPFSVVAFVAFLASATLLLWQYALNVPKREFETQTSPLIKAYSEAFTLTDPVARDEALRKFSPEELNLVNRYYTQQVAYQFQPRMFFLEAIYNPLVSTVMALLGFYITYAAYRAFRIRSLEASVMMLSAALVVLGSDPVGGWLGAQLNQLLGHHVVNLPLWADLDNRVLNSGMQRGLGIGIAVAVIAVSLRIFLGLERGLINVSGGED
jgi:hypothetical protein